MSPINETQVIETYESQVGSRGVTFYLRLRKHANERGELEMSAKKIGLLVGMHPDSVRKIIKRLAQAQMLGITNTTNEDGEKEPNKYTFLV